jgi:GWxTD domain-containing protein
VSRPLAAFALALAAALALACAGSAPAPPRRPSDLTNTHLSPALAPWLVGAIGRMAKPEEVEGWLELRDDAAASAYIEQFWSRRDPDPARPGNPLRELFEEREREADRRFSEAGYLGRRTDRGGTFVLYGEPTKVEFEIARREGEPPVERWDYASAARVGLNGRRPLAEYRFVKKGDLTVFFVLPLAERMTPMSPG